MAAYRWILLDYSGTLSLGALLFGRPDRLLPELKRCGLYSLGVTGLDVFWNRIVNPTWTEGSTTPAGYRGVMEKAVRALKSGTLSETDEASLSAAVSGFVLSYFEQSPIDRRWQPHLLRWSRDPSAALAVVTDHYAEATEAIIGHLRELSIEALTAGDITTDSLPTGTFVVANSADLGIHKAHPLFWQTLGQRAGLNTARKIILVDDFGANEQDADTYGGRQQVEARRRTSQELLQAAFPASIKVIPFIVEGQDRLSPEACHRLFGQRISETALAVDRFLSYQG
jgi:hypothetical protein